MSTSFPEELIGSLESTILAIGLMIPRIAAALLIMPLLSSDTVPALVRNSLFVSFALVMAPLVIGANTMEAIEPAQWPLILVKEILIGLALGYMFGSVFWAIGMAGGVIDTQVGSNMASLIDPIQGHQATLTGVWLSRFAAMLLMASGGFMVLLELLISSYGFWPVASEMPVLKMNEIGLFIAEFNYIMTTALVIAAPAMMLLAITDFVFGLINRFSEQLNVLSLTMPIKAWLATLTLILCLGMIVEVVLTKLGNNKNMLSILEPVFR